MEFHFHEGNFNFLIVNRLSSVLIKSTRKAPGGVNPAVVLSALGVQNILRPGKSC